MSCLPTCLLPVPTSSRGGAAGIFFPSNDEQEAYEKRYGQDTFTLSGEIAVPVISNDMDVPFVNNLLLNAAASGEEYSNVQRRGTNWSMGMNWGVNDWMTIRLNRNFSLRVPASVRSAGVTQWSYYSLGLRDSRPNGFPGFAAIRALRGGSDVLKPERNYGTSLGFIFRPASIDGLQVDVNFYRSATLDQIGTPRVGTVPWLEDLLNPQWVELHPLFMSSTEGYVENTEVNDGYNVPGSVIDGGDLREGPVVFDARQRNVGHVKNSGIDFETSYRLDSRYGDWIVSWRHNYTHENRVTRENLCKGLPADVCSIRSGVVFSNDNEVYDYGQPVNTVGTVDRRREVSDFPLPSHRGSVQLAWNHRGLSVAGTTSYQSDTHVIEEVNIDDVRDPDTNARIYTPIRATTRASSALTLSMGYEFSRGGLFNASSWFDNTRVRLTISNALVFQETEIERKRLDNGGAVEADAATYYNPYAIDPYGRRFVLSLSKSF